MHGNVYPCAFLLVFVGSVDRTIRHKEGKMLFLKAVEGFLLDAHARRLSHYTISDYSVTFQKLANFLGNDIEIEDIGPDEITLFLSAQEVSEKTLLNYHIALSSLWTWAVSAGVVKTHVVRLVRRPRPTAKEVRPFSEAEVRAMIRAARQSRPYVRPGKKETRHTPPQAKRNAAIILLMLDTGIRTGEVVALDVEDIDVKERIVRVKMGKGRKERFLPISAKTAQAVWRYLAEAGHDDGPLFRSARGGRLRRDSLSGLIREIGERAGVKNAHAHRFRHTFAIEFLRNGGDIFTLQRLLGHSSLDMVRRYLALSRADLETAHRRASPVGRWNL